MYRRVVFMNTRVNFSNAITRRRDISLGAAFFPLRSAGSDLREICWIAGLWTPPGAPHESLRWVCSRGGIASSRVKVSFFSRRHRFVSAQCITKQAAIKTTLTDVHVISAGGSRGTQTDAQLIYAAKLHLAVCAVCKAVN